MKTMSERQKTYFIELPIFSLRSETKYSNYKQSKWEHEKKSLIVGDVLLKIDKEYIYLQNFLHV